MQYNNLGRSGLRVSQLSYGAWVTFGNQLDVKEAKSLLQACRDAGVNFFDNAEVYANGRAEEIMGQAIRDLGWRRADVVISTKLFWGGQGPNDKGLSRKHIIEGLKASLKRLDMEQQQHNVDNERLGVESEFVPLYSTYGIGLTTWSPLASGVLTGKYSKGNIPAESRFALDNYKNLANRSLVDDTLRKVNGLKPIASELGVSMAQLGIAWCASNPNVSSVITGATKESQSINMSRQQCDEQQIVENMKALEVVPLLTPEVLEKIEAVVQSKPKRLESYR
ncbi:putative voltage-gated potassium channel subunit beta [Triticum urartu]|uniref:Putative voltage-gated potassium channel subunit beta n=1 Tax=Triticum urartu TaxID=4572 RepID=M7YMD5_TRIUA|nr:putative voltage-gated potassium channel subunit beta [Triticum urartu]